MNGIQNQPAWKSPFPAQKFHETKTHTQVVDLKKFLKSKDFLRYHSISFDAGHSIGCPSKWSLHFVSCGERPSSFQSNASKASFPADDFEHLGLFLDELKQTSDTNIYTGNENDSIEFIARCSIEVLDKNETVLVFREFETSPICKFGTGCWGWKKVVGIPYRQLSEATGDGNNNNDRKSTATKLQMRISFTIVGQAKDSLQKVPSSCVKLMTKEQDCELEYGRRFHKLLKSGRMKPDVTLQSAFGKDFYVHQAILAARSPVFLAMFETSMTERVTGTVVLKDVSSEGLEFLLRHMYTGQAQKEWLVCPKIASELVEYSERYWLSSLRVFCDKNLILAANRMNCLQLLELASLHELHNACDQLRKYVQCKMMPPNLLKSN